MDYEAQPLGELLSGIASTAVTPAGGTAGAVVGAIGTALCEMVCIHLGTADAAPDADLAACREELEDRRARMLLLAEADAEAVDELFASGGEDPSTVKRSVGVPLSLAETCLEALETATTVTGAADRPVVADAATGSSVLDAALRSALFTARNNLEYVDDPSFVEDVERRAADFEASADHALVDVLANVGGNP
jgi:formiminotetrahydrofolate cyclodeaminase